MALRAWRASASPTSRTTFGPGRQPASRPAVLASATHTKTFSLLGVTWRATKRAADLTVVVRAHGGKGWSTWTPLDPADEPAPGDLVTLGTEPLWVGKSDGYQVRVDLHSGALPRGLRVDLVAPGDSPADATAGQSRGPAAQASAAVAQPVINSRASWGADERIRNGGPYYNATIKEGFVHHTAGTNNYTAADVPKIIRGIYAYHVKGNGWSDIGYNFLVDRFGRLWEGRYGGITKAVLGAHTGGFNVDSFAVSAIGNFDKVATTPEMIDAIARLMAWKLSLYYRNPLGTTSLVSQGGGTSKYPAGTQVTFNVISGHRDAGNTECPGTFLYDQLANIRALTASYLGVGLINPATSSDLVLAGHAADRHRENDAGPAVAARRAQPSRRHPGAHADRLGRTRRPPDRDVGPARRERRRAAARGLRPEPGQLERRRNRTHLAALGRAAAAADQPGDRPGCAPAGGLPASCPSTPPASTTASPTDGSRSAPPSAWTCRCSAPAACPPAASARWR